MSDKPYLKKCSNHYPPRQTIHWLCAHGFEEDIDADGNTIKHRVHAPGPNKEVTSIDGRRYRMTIQGSLVRLS